MRENGGVSRYRVDAVAKALRLLEGFAEPPHRFNLTELSARADMSKNQAFRLLCTLGEAGFVHQEPETKAYRLGVRMFQLAGALLDGDDLLLAAGDALTWARDVTGETVNLIARDGPDAAICVDRRGSPRPLQISARVGARFALHAGASPKLLLAFSDDQTVDCYCAGHQPFPAFTATTITDPVALWAELRQIRARGYAISDEDLDAGACAVAAPIRNRRGDVIAGVSVASPASRFGPVERDRNRQVALEAAARISQTLGYQPSLVAALS